MSRPIGPDQYQMRGIGVARHLGVAERGRVGQDGERVLLDLVAVVLQEHEDAHGVLMPRPLRLLC